MKQSRRWTAFLTVLILAASLIFAQEGRAGPVRGCQLPGDPPTLPEISDPDVPVNPGPTTAKKVPFAIQLFRRGAASMPTGLYLAIEITSVLATHSVRLPSGPHHNGR